jgi:hypothetical protein
MEGPDDGSNEGIVDEASEGPWEDDSKGFCEGASMEGSGEGSKEGVIDNMGAPIDGKRERDTNGEGIADGPDDGS